MRIKSKLAAAFVRALLMPFFGRYVRMPGKSATGNLPALGEEEAALAASLRAHVGVLAGEIGERSLKTPASLARAADYIHGEFEHAGYRVERQSFDFGGQSLDNVIAELPGTTDADSVLVVGAHYDTVEGSPGADDNATGVAALLALALRLRQAEPACTVRFVAFANEEDSEGKGWKDMGSYKYALACHERGDNIIGMISLEMLGCFSDEEESQHYPFPFSLFYPTRGNFIGFVSNWGSRKFVREVVRLFRLESSVPSYGVAAPERFSDIARSDHWGFWQFGWPALMVTDTSNFRYAHVHTHDDTPDKIDFDRMVRVVFAIEHVLVRLAGEKRE